LRRQGPWPLLPSRSRIWRPPEDSPEVDARSNRAHGAAQNGLRKPGRGAGSLGNAWPPLHQEACVGRSLPGSSPQASARRSWQALSDRSADHRLGSPARENGSGRPIPEECVDDHVLHNSSELHNAGCKSSTQTISTSPGCLPGKARQMHRPASGRWKAAIAAHVNRSGLRSAPGAESPAVVSAGYRRPGAKNPVATHHNQVRDLLGGCSRACASASRATVSARATRQAACNDVALRGARWGESCQLFWKKVEMNPHSPGQNPQAL